jgi:hypothetical protein
MREQNLARLINDMPEDEQRGARHDARTRKSRAAAHDGNTTTYEPAATPHGR